MEQLSIIEIWLISAVVLVALFVSWKQHQKPDLKTGFNQDYLHFMRAIKSENSIIALKGFQWGVSVFRSEHRKSVDKEALDDACGRLHAEIINRIANLELIAKIENDLANQNQS